MSTPYGVEAARRVQVVDEPLGAGGLARLAAGVEREEFVVVDEADHAAEAALGREHVVLARETRAGDVERGAHAETLVGREGGGWGSEVGAARPLGSALRPIALVRDQRAIERGDQRGIEPSLGPALPDPQREERFGRDPRRLERARAAEYELRVFGQDPPRAASRSRTTFYDNVPDERVLSAWLPTGGLAYHVLATSTCAYPRSACRAA